MATLLAWVVFLVVLGPVILGVGRVVATALIYGYHFVRPWDEVPMTAAEHQAALDAQEERRRQLREMEREQESWT